MIGPAENDFVESPMDLLLPYQQRWHNGNGATNGATNGYAEPEIDREAMEAME